LRPRLREVILEGVAGYVEQDSGSDDRLLGAYASHCAMYRVDVVFPVDHVRRHPFDFGHEQPRVSDGRAPARLRILSIASPPPR
jgi:hypothetical protein